MLYGHQMVIFESFKMNLNEKICYMLEYAGKGIAKPFKNTMNAPALTS